MSGYDFFDQTVGGLDFHSVCAPAEVPSGRYIAASDYIYPKCLVDVRLADACGDRHGLVSGGLPDFGCAFVHMTAHH